MLVTYQIKALGLVNINLSTKNFFEILGPEKAQGGGAGNEKGKISFSPKWLATRRVCKMLFCTSTLYITIKMILLKNKALCQP